MKQVPDYMNEIQKAKGIPSDYALAELLNVSRTHVSNWRNQVNEPDTYNCARMADQLGINKLEIIAAASAVRARRQKKKEQAAYWENVWKKVRGGSVGAIIALAALGFSGTESTAYAQPVATSDSLLHAVSGYIIRTARRLRHRLARFMNPEPHAVTA